jgi:hypothetical protein
MAFEPINIFSHRIDPRGVAELLRAAATDVKVSGPDDDVSTGDVLTLAIARTGSAPGDFVGVDLRIEAEVVPEAGSLIIWILTIACAVVFYSRRRLINS